MLRIFLSDSLVYCPLTITITNLTHLHTTESKTKIGNNRNKSIIIKTFYAVAVG